MHRKQTSKSFVTWRVGVSEWFWMKLEPMIISNQWKCQLEEAIPLWPCHTAKALPVFAKEEEILLPGLRREHWKPTSCLEITTQMNFAALATCFWLTLQVTTFGVHMAEHLLGLQLCPRACTDVPMGDFFTSTPGSISTNPTISAVWIGSTYAGHGVT